METEARQMMKDAISVSYTHLDVYKRQIVDSKIYETGNAAKSFKSPMKELNEQTVLIENAKTNKNDSCLLYTSS